MNEMKLRFLLLALLTLRTAPLRADDLAAYHPAEASAAAVTETNLLASERFWPYQVALTKPWQSPGGRAVAAGASGVLIRVEPGGIARVDFGRDGLHEVPVSTTDLVARADRIRRGELDKMAPNFALAIGPRLLDAAADPLRPFSVAAVMERRGFLAVFADPDSESFAELAAALAPLSDRDGVLTVLFPRGRHSDAKVQEKLRAVKWTPVFVFDHLSESYTLSLIDERTPRPMLLLQTNEGRVLFQSPWKPGVVPDLTAVLDRAFGTPAPE